MEFINKEQERKSDILKGSKEHASPPPNRETFSVTHFSMEKVKVKV